MMVKSAAALLIGATTFGAVILTPVTARAVPLPGEDGTPCPALRVVKVLAGWEDSYRVCAGDPAVRASARIWVITNTSEGVLRVSPGIGNPRLQAFLPTVTAADAVSGLTAELVPTAAATDGSVLVAPNGSVRATGGSSVRIAMDYSASSVTTLAGALAKTGIEKLGLGFANRFSDVQSCARGASGIFEELGDHSRPASFFDAAPKLVVASECRPLWKAIERDLGGTNGLKTFEKTAVREVAENAWRPIAKLVLKYIAEIAVRVR
ncbi:hypothetical protein [Nocardia sp. NPDC005825]|uniref:hypothetical protein n=1 Tax=unclassified Nocardia TaxID=2637762 RepID=UPI0033F768C2